MPAGKRMRAALLLSVFVRVLSGLELTCTVSHDGGRTTYRILDVFCDQNAKKPHFSWFNQTKYVLANHRSHMELVMSSSFNALTTTRCIEHLLCEGHVTSEGKPLDYSANCTTTCPPGGETGDKGALGYSIAAGVVIFLLLAGIAGFLCHKYANLGQWRCGSFYTFVKNGNQRAENVETGNGPAARTAPP